MSVKNFIIIISTGLIAISFVGLAIFKKVMKKREKKRWQEREDEKFKRDAMQTYELNKPVIVSQRLIKHAAWNLTIGDAINLIRNVYVDGEDSNRATTVIIEIYKRITDEHADE